MTAKAPGVSLVALCLLGLLGCAQGPPEKSPRLPRPMAGDSVTPEVIVAGTWKGGQTGLFGIRCRVEGKAGAELLLSQEVPEDLVPRVAVTFFRGEAELSAAEPERLERCC